MGSKSCLVFHIRISNTKGPAEMQTLLLCCYQESGRSFGGFVGARLSANRLVGLMLPKVWAEINSVVWILVFR